MVLRWFFKTVFRVLPPSELAEASSLPLVLPPSDMPEAFGVSPQRRSFLGLFLPKKVCFPPSLLSQKELSWFVHPGTEVICHHLGFPGAHPQAWQATP